LSRFSFLHAADIHLDSPLRGLEADPDAPAEQIRTASRAAFRNLIDLAIEEEVAFVLIAGDLYDGDWQDYRTGIFLVEQAARLASVQIPLFILQGNHDAASVITKHLRLPDNTRLISAKQPETIILDQLSVAIHGRSFPTKAVNDDLTVDYPQAHAGLFNIGLLHTALGNADHDNYAPTRVDTLVSKGYEYWALGHVHARAEVLQAPCWIVFPGNLQGRHVKETGPKGASLVTVQDSRVVSVEHRPLDVLRWCRLEVDLESAGNIDDALALAGRTLATALGESEGRPIAVRLVLTGRTVLHNALVTGAEDFRQGVIAEGRHYGAGQVWIESVVRETAPVLDVTALAQRPDAVGRLVHLLEDLVTAPPPALLGEYGDRLREKLRGIDLGDDHPLNTGLTPALMVRLRDMVLARLAAEV
jgi:DNA repair exonuclease SbcCD nuclease subunit